MTDKYYTSYYSNQAGGGYNHEDFGPLLRFHNIYQKGRGIGGFFNGIFRYLSPLLSSALQGLKSGAIDAGTDFLRGKPVNQIFRDTSIQMVDKLRDKAAEKIKQMSGSGICKKSIKGRLQALCNQSKAIRKRSTVKKRKPNISKKKTNKSRIIDIFT